METKEQSCFIWGVGVTRIERLKDKNNLVVVGSPRAGGDYEITDQAIQDVRALEQPEKAKLTTILIKLRREGDHAPLLNSDLVEKAKSADPLPVDVRAERLLRHLLTIPKHVGEWFETLPTRDDPKALARSESTTPKEIAFFLNYLTHMKWLEPNKVNSYRITVSGYQHVAEQSTKRDLSQCFVAMWFDDSMNPAYEEGIKKAVEECGYKPLRIDLKKDVNKIDDEIIAEIRRSRFVVADFTHDKETGDRGGVYYEAGFAYGLGLEVIYSCQKGLEGELHFDTRQYYHILWETPEDLCKQLRDRIRARVWDYRAEPALAVSE